MNGDDLPLEADELKALPETLEAELDASEDDLREGSEGAETPAHEPEAEDLPAVTIMPKSQPVARSEGYDPEIFETACSFAISDAIEGFKNGSLADLGASIKSHLSDIYNEEDTRVRLYFVEGAGKVIAIIYRLGSVQDVCRELITVTPENNPKIHQNPETQWMA